MLMIAAQDDITKVPAVRSMNFLEVLYYCQYRIDKAKMEKI